MLMSIPTCQKNSLIVLGEFFHRLGTSHTYNYIFNYPLFSLQLANSLLDTTSPLFSRCIDVVVYICRSLSSSLIQDRAPKDHTVQRCSPKPNGCSYHFFVGYSICTDGGKHFSVIASAEPSMFMCKFFQCLQSDDFLMVVGDGKKLHSSCQMTTWYFL